MGEFAVLGLLLAVLIGVSLGFFGGGGSILTVPLLVYVFRQEPKQAIASSLLIVGTTSIVAALQHARAGNVRAREGLLFGAAGMAGAYLGGRASALLDGGFLLLLFAAMMILTSVAMWRGRGTPDKDPGPVESAVPKLLAQGFVVGVFTGVIGVGGGFLIVPALALWGGLPMAAAVGTSLLVIVLNSAAAFLGHASHVTIDYQTAGAVTGCAIAGSFAGSRLARVVDPSSMRRAFAGFVLAMAGFILIREGPLVAAAVADALPRNLPQILFALVMLALGVVAGRSSRNAAARSGDLTYHGGGGI